MMRLFNWFHSNNNPDYPKTMPEDFNFKANWYFDHFTLDTFKNKLTKTIHYGDKISIAFTLKEKQKKKIYKLLRRIDFLSFPERFIPEGEYITSEHPRRNHILEVELSGKKNATDWYLSLESEHPKAKGLREIFDYLHKIVSNNKAVKALPEDKRRFM